MRSTYILVALLTLAAALAAPNPGHDAEGIGSGTFTGNYTFNGTLTVNGSFNISDAGSSISTPELCLNGDCQSSWPAAGGSGNITGGGSANHLAYWTNNTNVGYDNGQLYWDAANNRLGIGVSPTQALHVSGNVLSTGSIEGANLYADSVHTRFGTSTGGSTATHSAYVGSSAGYLNTGNYSTFMGFQAGYRNLKDSSTGIGYIALYQNNGTGASSVGHSSGMNNKGDYTTMIGHWSGISNTGNYGSFLGYQAGRSNIGAEVVGIGYNSAYHNNGSYTIGIGTGTVMYNTANHVIGIGREASYNNKGSNTISIGYNAGMHNNGSHTISLGYSAGLRNRGNYSTFIGNAAGEDNDQDNVLVIKQNPINTVPLIFGRFDSGMIGINTSTPTQALDVNGSANVTGIVYTPQLCLNGDCQSSWPAGSSSLWTNSSNNATYTAGRVGIGTTTPSATLHINSSTGAALLVQNGTSTQFFVNGTTGMVGVGTADPSTQFVVYGNGANRFTVGANGATDVRIQDASNEDFAVYYNNVQLLSVGAWYTTINRYENGNPYTFRVGTRTTTFNIYNPNAHPIAFGTDDTERMRITATGLVGINTTTPQATLHVDGTVRVNDSIIIGWRLNNATGLQNSILGGGSSSNAHQITTSNYSIIGSGRAHYILNSADGGIFSGYLNGLDTATYSVIAGGRDSQITYSTASAILGGMANEVHNSVYSAVVAGWYNSIYDGGNHSFIGAGEYNEIHDTSYAVIGGGSSNIVTGQYGSIVGGSSSNASGSYTFIGGGQYNLANGSYASVPSGLGLIAQGYGQTAIGRYNTLQGTGASSVYGDHAFIIGNGTAAGSRSNAFYVTNDGTTWTRVLNASSSICLDGVCRTSWPAGTITGSGAAGYVARWSGATSIGNSAIYDDGTRVSLGTTTIGAMLTINDTSSNGALHVLDSSGGTLLFVDGSTNRIGIGTDAPNETLSVVGNINATGGINAFGGVDLAEAFTALEPMAPGELVVSAGPHSVRKATREDAHLVIGAVTTQPGFTLGNGNQPNSALIGIAGRIPVRVSGEIEPGDFITVSATPGVGERAQAAGFVIGRSLESNTNGTVMMLIQPTYFNPAVRVDGSLVGGERKKLKFAAAGSTAVSDTAEIDALRLEVQQLQVMVAAQPATPQFVINRGRDVEVVLG